MEILIASNSCSEKKYQQICGMRKKKLIDPQQKFFRLMIDGFAANPQANVTVASALPVSASTVNQYVFRKETEITSGGACYRYLPFLNGKISRYLSLIVSSFFLARKWCQENRGRQAWVIVDPLIPVVSIPVRLVAQKIGIPVAAVITDIPTLSTNMKGRKENILKHCLVSAYQRIADRDLHAYNAYIPLTESLNDVANTKRRPHIVIEGFADSRDTTLSDVHENYIMYAGGVFEKYGVRALTEAFLSLNRPDICLYIFGEGPYTETLEKIQAAHPNVKYMGCVSPEEAVAFEKKALLLVNPRPTDEEFSKYSFPSKTMEYLLSGTATASTLLPGIPGEYFEYILPMHDDSTEGLAKALEEILRMPKEQLQEIGHRGHDFAIREKNNVFMAGRIYSFLEKCR